MKKSLLALALLTLTLSLVSAASYLGISQSPVSTSLDVGFLTRSIDQNITFSLPLLGALDSGDNPFQYPVASLNLLYKKKIGTTVAIGFGPTLRVGWEYKKAIGLQAGLLLQLSLEAPKVMDSLFCELGYLPDEWKLLKGSDFSTLLEDSIGQFVRFGYRHAF